MTWKEFKTFIEAQGVEDDMEIDYIDWTPICDPSARINTDDSFYIE